MRSKPSHTAACALLCALALLNFASCVRQNNNNSAQQQPTPTTTATQTPAPSGSPGPAATGFSLAAPTTGEGNSLREAGLHPSLALNGDEDPMVAYLTKEQGGPINLCFVAWDRKSGRWTAPVTIDTVSELFESSPQLQLARDASNNMLGIAYHKAPNDVELATSSDSGATWQKEKVSAQGVEATDVTSNPALGMAQGKEYVSFSAGDKLYFLTRAGTSGPFNSRTAPTLPGTSRPRDAAPALALDGSGRPALAYFLDPQQDYTMVVAFWRPDDTAAYKVTDSNNQGTDSPYISLAFASDKPRVAVNMMRNEDNFNTGPTYFIASSDDAKTWGAPVHIAQDGGNAMYGFLSVAAQAQAGAAIAAPVTGGNEEGTRCGQPKLARSSELTAWTTCSPDANRSMNFSARYSSLIFDGKGKLYLAFENAPDSTSSIGRGLVVWREP
ncbi:MAG: hypothetical protein M3362_20320 [Acidobacteriota bacterium]|nr:hypothetical protein [Acidobacteriota bacterium]